MQHRNGKHEVEKTGEAGTAASAADNGVSQHVRQTALTHALDLHRGKGMSADKIVAEAAVFESYFIHGAAPTRPESSEQTG